jgi:AbrB family looped-hinge helix DNA binding protein
MSSKGQVVIPESVRKALGLEVGAQFVVMGDGDTVVLKRGGSPRPPRALKLSWTPDPRAAIRVASACPSILLSAR